MRDGNSFPFVCVRFLLVILVCKSIVLCKCSGNRIIGYSRKGAWKENEEIKLSIPPVQQINNEL